MAKQNPRVPLGLPITGVLLLALGYFAGPFIASRYTAQEMARNVLLSAIPFILIFAAILIFFISFIWFVASRLNHNISPAVYRPIEMLLIGGIVFGVLGMFQPWLFVLYKLGFMMVLFSLLGFILWSHIKPGHRP